MKSKMEKVVEVSKHRGIIFPTAEIYSSLAGFWDYGPIGTRMKRKIEDYWQEFFVSSEENIVEIDGCIVLPESVFEASGHLDSFVDPITQCTKCKSIHRADHLIEEATKKFVEGKTVKELTEIIRKNKIACPSCGGQLSDVRMFNLMLKTDVSATGDQPAYLRPETAQNIFTAFRRVFVSSRGKLPFGISQIGHSFRNEISPRHFVIRLREFNQFEIEMFIDPKDADNCPNFKAVAKTKLNFFTRDAQQKGGKPTTITADDALKQGLIPTKWLAYFMAKQMQFYQSLGIPAASLRHRHMLPEETPHYSKGNFDMEIEFDFGWKETVGNAYRGDYDLQKHMKHSKTDLSVSVNGRKVVPHVVEPSFGLERTFAGVLLHCFCEDKKRGWNWFAFPANIAPYTIAVMPLMKKDKLPAKAKEVCGQLAKVKFDAAYDDSGSIGKRYARMDEIGVPYCATIDYQTLEDGTITLRDRDTTKQVRIPIKEVCSVLWGLVSGTKEFEKVGKALNKVK